MQRNANLLSKPEPCSPAAVPRCLSVPGALFGDTQGGFGAAADPQRGTDSNKPWLTASRGCVGETVELVSRHGSERGAHFPARTAEVASVVTSCCLQRLPALVRASAADAAAWS